MAQEHHQHHLHHHQSLTLLRYQRISVLRWMAEPALESKVRIFRTNAPLDDTLVKSSNHHDDGVAFHGDLYTARPSLEVCQASATHRSLVKRATIIVFQQLLLECCCAQWGSGPNLLIESINETNLEKKKTKSWLYRAKSTATPLLSMVPPMLPDDAGVGGVMQVNIQMGKCGNEMMKATGGTTSSRRKNKIKRRKMKKPNENKNYSRAARRWRWREGSARVCAAAQHHSNTQIYILYLKWKAVKEKKKVKPGSVLKRNSG